MPTRVLDVELSIGIDQPNSARCNVVVVYVASHLANACTGSVEMLETRAGDDSPFYDLPFYISSNPTANLHTRLSFDQVGFTRDAISRLHLSLYSR